MSAQDPTKGGDRGTGQRDGERDRSPHVQPVVVRPPLVVSLDAEQEQDAINTLAELLAAWYERHQYDQ